MADLTFKAVGTISQKSDILFEHTLYLLEVIM